MGEREKRALQKAVIKEFLPQFAKESVCLYAAGSLSETAVIYGKKLQKLGFNLKEQNKWPAIISYRRDKDWVYFIETRMDTEPFMSSKRIEEIEKITSKVKSGKIYITAVPDRKTYKKIMDEIAWNTTVWIAEIPDHMIHLDCNNFLVPHLK